MAVITGTTGTDILIGTDEADILKPLGTTVAGTREVLRGLDGGDTYDLQRSANVGIYNFLIDDRGTDGAVDAITNVGPLYQSASLGYSAYATAVRIGDNLIFHAPSKPHRFNDPAKPSYDIKIKDQFGDGHIETMQAGGVTYNLVMGPVGTDAEDLMAGTRQSDTFSSGGGNDWVFGNGGHDSLNSGAGDDVVFGGAGRDDIRTEAGNDQVFGDAGADTIRSGSGHDRVTGGAGNDRVWAGDGTDWISGGDGNDVIRAEAGLDTLIGGAGNDRLIGGKGGDSYQFHSRLGDAGWGHDFIRDVGDKPSYLNSDKIELSGLYGPSDGDSQEAYDRLGFTRSGEDMMITVDDGVSSINVRNMFHSNANRWGIENLELSAGYWSPIVFQIISADADAIGDDRDYVNGGYGGAANELIFGSDGDDQVFGDAGVNFIWTGAGADTLIYKENDSENWFGYGGGSTRDTVEDFDVLADTLDFSEVKSVNSLSDLTRGEDADGDATLYWNSGDYEVASIFIELRGVGMAEVTQDMFVFV
ncbi:calcium-binding protein [Arenibacterium sp. CAU 1754]